MKGCLSTGLVHTPYNQEYKTDHRLTLNVFKNFGFGAKNIIEGRIHMEMERLADYFRNMKGQSFNPMRVMFGAVSNIVTGITLGQRYDYNDPKLQQLNDYTHEFVHNCVFILDIMPWVRILPTIKKKIAIGRNAFDLYMDLMKAEVEKSLKSDEDSFVKQYVEAKGGEYDREQLNFIVRDLLMAGTDTTANSMLWSLIMLANNPEVQRQLRQEIDLVVPKTRLPSLNDRQHLPLPRLPSRNCCAGRRSFPSLFQEWLSTTWKSMDTSFQPVHKFVSRQDKN